MKKKIVRILIIILAVIVVIGGVFTALFWNELRSLSSLKKVNDYPMYTMSYYGDYGFDDFLKQGAKSDSGIEDFVAARLLKGLPIDLGVTGDGCTAFVTRDDEGDVIFGRNFDFDYTPSMQVRTCPDNGYASISTVNLTYAGYDKDHLPEGFDSFLALAAPFLPFDGVNEKGVAIAILAVPEAEGPSDTDKITLNTTTAVRLVLDKAASVDEAVDLLKNYNIYFSGDVQCHFLIADAAGRSLIVEYWDGELRTVEPGADYQAASNFIAYDGLNIGEGYSEFDRYDTVVERIEKYDAAMPQSEAIKLLCDVGCYSRNGDDRLQWSVLYDLTDLDGTIFIHRDPENQLAFSLS